MSATNIIDWVLYIFRFVEAYQSRFGAIPLSKKRKEKQILQNFLLSCPDLVIRGDNPSVAFVELRNKTPPPTASKCLITYFLTLSFSSYLLEASVTSMDKPNLESINAEFVQLLTAFPDNQLPLR